MSDSNEQTWTLAELAHRVAHPSGPEDWSDVIAALADRLSTSLETRGTLPIDEAAIVRNFAEAVLDMRIVVEGFVGDYEHHADEWANIRDCLDNAAAGLTDIAQGWI